MIVDVHGHTLDLAWRRGLALDASFPGPTDVPRMRAAGVTAQLCPTWTPDTARSGPHAYSVVEPRRALDAMLDYLEAELRGAAGTTTLLARTGADLQAAEATGRVALVLGMEGTDAFGGDAAALRRLHGRGLRHVGLVHEHANDFGTASQVWEHGRMRRHDPRRDTARHPTETGRALLGEMKRLGMLIDLTHLVEPAFWDVLDVVSGPVVVTHGGVRRADDSTRYPSDAMIRAVARTGGFVAASPTPLGPSDERPGLELLLDTVDRLVELAGDAHVAVGTDFLDQTDYYPPGLAHVGELPAVASGLAARGHAPDAVARILGGNFARVFEQVAG